MTAVHSNPPTYTPSLSSSTFAEFPKTMPDYTQPRIPRWRLNLKTSILRQASTLAHHLANRGLPPPFTLHIPSTLSATSSGPSQIQLDIYQPYIGSIESTTPTRLRPCVIDFHGGGYVLGAGTDDARWADTCVKGLDAVVVCVSYRLAPAYPFPTPVEDCADAVLYIAREAVSLGIDVEKMTLSGFSAGGNLALSTWLLLNHPAEFGYAFIIPAPTIRALVTIYPATDWRIPRSTKRSRCPNPALTLPTSLTDVFDASHLPAGTDTSDPRLSPSAATDAQIATIPPLHMVVCEHDMLRQEAIEFAERIRGMRGDVVVREVKGEQHGWDRPPPLRVKESVVVEYEAAVESLGVWLGDVERRLNRELL